MEDKDTLQILNDIIDNNNKINETKANIIISNVTTTPQSPNINSNTPTITPTTTPTTLNTSWKSVVPKRRIDTSGSNIPNGGNSNTTSPNINSSTSSPANIISPLLSPSRKANTNVTSPKLNNIESFIPIPINNNNHSNNHSNGNSPNSNHTPPHSPQFHLNNLHIDDDNNNNQTNNRPKLIRENSILNNNKRSSLSTIPMNNSSNSIPIIEDEILIKVWLPMEYTGQLYKVRKFSGGSSTLKVSSILNSQLSPMYQSTKNKLFLNNEEKPIPNHLTLKDLSLSKYDILYLRREPEYELIIPSNPNCGSLVLDKDIKIDEMLIKIEHWLKDILDGSNGSNNGNQQPQQPILHVDKQEYFTSIEDQHLMNGHIEVSSQYTLLKKLSVPTASSRITGKLSRGYYLRLYDQKPISNYGIKIKDTLIFKKKALNRGLAIDDAEGGIEISVLYSPLSMLPTTSDLGFEKELRENQQAQQQAANNNSSNNLIPIPPPPPQQSTLTSTLTLNNQTLLTGLIKIDQNSQLLNELKNEKKNRKSKRTPSSVGLPFNIVHKTHVDFEYKWSGATVEDTFEFKEKLGQGGYGAVFKVQHRETNFPLAIKVLSITPTRLKDIEKEIDLLKKCRCPNVLSYYGSINSKLTELWILMDYCAVGSIKDMMKTCCDTLDEEQIAVVTLNVLNGLGYLHSKGIVHLDVKAANILLTEDKQIKIADFGVSQQLQTPYGQTNVFIGSPLYMAPEVIQKAPYNFKADIWSLGITLIELAEGRPPGRGLKSMNQLVEIPNMPPPKLSNPKDWSPCFNDFLSTCLIKDPEQRPCVTDLLSHDFIKNSKTTDVLSNLIKQTLSSRISI